MAVIGRIRQMTGLLVFVIALAILCFLLMDATGAGNGAVANSVGEVNGVQLDAREYARRVDQTLSNAQRNGQEVTDATRIQAKNSAYNNYVKDILADQEYEKLGISVTGDEMQELLYGADPHPSIKNEPTFQDNGVYSPDKVRAYLDEIRSTGEMGRAKSWNIFKNFVRKDAKRKKYNSLIGQAMYVPKFLAETKNVENGTAAIEYVKIPYTQIKDDEVQISDSDLRAYLNDNKAEFEQDESRAVDYVVFDLDASDQDIAATKGFVDDLAEDFRTTGDADLASFLSLNSETPYTDTYVSKTDLTGNPKADEIFAAAAGTIIPTFLDNNVYKTIKVVDKTFVSDTVEARHILRKVEAGADDTAAKKTIDSLKTAIENGYDFDAAASAFSEDGSNSGQGGDLGKVTQGRMVKPFNDLIFYGMKQGELGTVKTRFGWHLVRLDKSTPTKQVVKFAELSRAIEASEETTGETYRKASEFAGRNNTATKLRGAAEQLGLTIQNSGDFTRESTAIGTLGASETLLNWAFTADKDDVSEVLDLGDKYAVCILTDKKDAGMPNVDDVRDRLESAVKNQKKAEKIMSQINGSDLNAIASQFSTTVGNAEGLKYNFISTGDLGREPKVIAAAFSLKEGEVSKPFAGDQGVFLVKNTSMAVTDIADMASFQQTERTKAQNGVEFYSTEALFKNADVSDARLERITFTQQQPVAQ